MIVEYKAELKTIERTLDGVFTPFLAPVFEAILCNMRETNKSEFYEALANFTKYDSANLAE